MIKSQVRRKKETVLYVSCSNEWNILQECLFYAMICFDFYRMADVYLPLFIIDSEYREPANSIEGEYLHEYFTP